MQSLIQQIGIPDLSGFFTKLSEVIVQPFVHSFQSVVPGFMPHVKSLVMNDPGLVGGVFFVALTYSVIIWTQETKKARITVTNKRV